MEPLPPGTDLDALVAARIDAVMPLSAMLTLRVMARQAAERGWSVYLVGGYVRDCLLKIPDYDIDVSVEGDATGLARLVGDETGAKVEVHTTFGTALLTWEPEVAPFDIDLVTARRETYEHPGALPTVEPGTILDDLARRDFTVNAMAVRLEASHTGPLLDPYDGIADMQAGVIRVLHDRSFLDDPTRIFRAVRLSIRLGFTLERGTLDLIEQAVKEGALGTVSMDRTTHELRLIWQEPRAARMLIMLNSLGALAAVDATLAAPQPEALPPEDSPLSPGDRKSAYLALLGFGLGGKAGEAGLLARHLRLDNEEATILQNASTLARLWPELLDPLLRRSQVRRKLAPLSTEALEAFRLLPYPRVEMQAMIWLDEYLSKLRHIRTELTGDYLRALGVPPGPIYREALGALLNARLDGQVRTAQDEARFLREWLRQRGLLPEQ